MMIPRVLFLALLASAPLPLLSQARPPVTRPGTARSTQSAAFTALSAGGGFTCGLTTGGAAYCWGYNFFGQLGDGTTSNNFYGPHVAMAQPNRTSPVAVSGGLTFQAISAGASHTCGLTTGGAAYCWGQNNYGQLGDGDTTDRVIPTAAMGGLTFQAISAGRSHTCGLTRGGAAYCWGGIGGGALGDGFDNGTDRGRKTPVAVAGGLVFQAIGVGASYTCGLTTGGAAYCWGQVGHGQVGVGYQDDRPTPVAVSGGLTFQAISVGASHTCGLTRGGAAYCWGSNLNGGLGDGTSDTSRSSPVPVSGGVVFRTISAGSETTCGLTAGGAAFCWGRNSSGQAGDGTSDVRLSPVAVSGGLVFRTISAGSDHTCGITSVGASYCWGDNTTGQLGDSTSGESRSSPVAVISP